MIGVHLLLCGLHPFWRSAGIKGFGRAHGVAALGQGVALLSEPLWFMAMEAVFLADLYLFALAPDIICAGGRQRGLAVMSMIVGGAHAVGLVVLYT